MRRSCEADASPTARASRTSRSSRSCRRPPGSSARTTSRPHARSSPPSPRAPRTATGSSRWSRACSRGANRSRPRTRTGASASCFEHLARDRPLVVVFDDIHWAEPAFLELIEHLADWTRDAPLLLLCVARPELLELRRDWAGGKMNATTILLEPLAERRGRRTWSTTCSAGRTSPRRLARTRILDAAEGNPLFVEEMLGMLIDDGLLRFEGGDVARRRRPRERHGPADDPAAARRAPGPLDAEERAVIERGAVEGKVFHAGAVDHARPRSAPAEGSPPPARARAQGADPSRSGRVRRRGRVPVPPPADPRRRVPGDAEGAAGRAPRAVRGLARARGRRAPRRVRGDPRATTSSRPIGTGSSSVRRTKARGRSARRRRAG